MVYFRIRCRLLEELQKNYNDELPFLVERMKMVRKLVPNLKNKNTYVVHIKSLNQAFNAGF